MEGRGLALVKGKASNLEFFEKMDEIHFPISSLFILLSGCETVTMSVIIAKGVLSNHKKTYSDEPTEVEAAEYDTQPDKLEVANVEVTERE